MVYGTQKKRIRNTETAHQILQRWKNSSVNSVKKVSATFVGNVGDKIVNKIRKRKIGK